MSNNEVTNVTGKGGWHGTVLLSEQNGVPDPHSVPQNHRVDITADDGRVLSVPANFMVRQDDGSFYIPLSLSDLGESEPKIPRESIKPVPVVAQLPSINQMQQQQDSTPDDKQRQSVETGSIRIQKTASERQEVIDDVVLQEELQIERVPVNRPVDGPQSIRYEGDTMIVPLLEEVVVVVKRLMLKEEIRITRKQFQARNPQTVTLRSEDAAVDRVGPSGSQNSDQDMRKPAA